MVCSSIYLFDLNFNVYFMSPIIMFVLLPLRLRELNRNIKDKQRYDNIFGIYCYLKKILSKGLFSIFDQ